MAFTFTRTYLRCRHHTLLNHFSSFSPKCVNYSLDHSEWILINFHDRHHEQMFRLFSHTPAIQHLISCWWTYDYEEKCFNVIKKFLLSSHQAMTEIKKFLSHVCSTIWSRKFARKKNCNCFTHKRHEINNVPAGGGRCMQR